MLNATFTITRLPALVCPAMKAIHLRLAKEVRFTYTNYYT